MKVPIEILEKIKRIESQDIIVACAKRIPLSNIENGMYRHIGIDSKSGSVSYKKLVLPQSTIGRYSKYNVQG